MYIVEAYKIGLKDNKTGLILRENNITYGPIVIPWNHHCPSQRTTFDECVKLIEDALFKYFDTHLGIKDAKGTIRSIMSCPSVSIYQKSSGEFSKNNRLLENIEIPHLRPDILVRNVNNKYNISDADLKVQYYFSIPNNLSSIIPHFYIKHYAGKGNKTKYVVQFYGMREINGFVKDNFPRSFFDNSVTDMIKVNLDFGNEVSGNFLALLKSQKRYNDLVKKFYLLNFGFDEKEREKLVSELVKTGNDPSEMKISFLKERLKGHFSGLEEKIMKEIEKSDLRIPIVSEKKAIPFLVDKKNLRIFDNLPKTYLKQKYKLSLALTLPSYLLRIKSNLAGLKDELAKSASAIDENSYLEMNKVLYIHFSTNKIIRGKFK